MAAPPSPLRNALALLVAIASTYVLLFRNAPDAIEDIIPSMVHATSRPNDGGGG